MQLNLEFARWVLSAILRQDISIQFALKLLGSPNEHANARYTEAIRKFLTMESSHYRNWNALNFGEASRALMAYHCNRIETLSDPQFNKLLNFLNAINTICGNQAQYTIVKSCIPANLLPMLRPTQ